MYMHMYICVYTRMHVYTAEFLIAWGGDGSGGCISLFYRSTRGFGRQGFKRLRFKRAAERECRL